MYTKICFIFACFAAIQAAVIPVPISGVSSSQTGDLSSIESNATVDPERADSPECVGFLHYYEGPKFIIANRTSGIVRVCAVDHPACCYTLAKIDEQITSIASAGRYVYLGLYNSRIMRCLLEKIDSCQDWTHDVGGSVRALVVAEDHLFAGLGTGVMLQCQLEDNPSCNEFNNFGRAGSQQIAINALTFVITGVVRYGYIFAALGNNSMLRCSADIHNNCILFNELDQPTSLTMSEDRKFILSGLSSGELFECDSYNKRGCHNKNKRNLNSKILSLSVFGEHVYAGLSDGTMTRCPKSDTKNCENVNNYGFEFSFIIVERAVITDGIPH